MRLGWLFLAVGILTGCTDPEEIKFERWASDDPFPDMDLTDPEVIAQGNTLINPYLTTFNQTFNLNVPANSSRFVAIRLWDSSIQSSNPTIHYGTYYLEEMANVQVRLMNEDGVPLNVDAYEINGARYLGADYSPISRGPGQYSIYTDFRGNASIAFTERYLGSNHRIMLEVRNPSDLDSDVVVQGGFIHELM